MDPTATDDAPTVARFLSAVYRLCGADEFKAVDAIYDFMDDRLLAGSFSTCGAVFREIDPARLLPSCIVSLLIVTQRAKSKLGADRSFFVDKVIGILSAEEGPEEAERLLATYA